MLQILKYSICALGCILFTLPCFGQQTQEVSASGTPYLQFLPADYNSTTKKYPVLIVLHGTGERGTNLNQVLNTGVSKRIQQGSNMTFNAGGTGPEFSFIVMSPQITGSWNAGITNGLIDHAINNLRGDPARIYVTGFSLGGNGTWIYAINSRNQPSRVAAIAPIAGWGAAHLVCSAGNYNEYSVWAFHGDADGTITINRGQAMIDAYNGCVPAASPQAMFTIYPGVGHNSWDRAYTTDHSVQNPNLYEWLLTQKLGGSPSANAGTDVTLTLPVNSTTINGSGNDPGGSIVSYLWAKVTGPTVTLSNASTSNLSLSAMVAGVYEFSLTVTDNDGNTATDNVLVTVNPVVVNQAPTIASNPPITLTLPTNSTNVVAVASDVDGTIASYAWIQKPGGPSTATLSGTTTATLITSSLIEGSYTFQLTVTDDDGATASRDFIIIVNPAAVNQPPTSNAGADVPINLPTSSTNLIGSGSDPDGSIASYAWIKVSGPTATLANTNTPTLSISSLVSGVYTFRLTVTDNLGLTDSDEATVTVVAANQAPTANAGSDFSITLPTSSTNVVGSGNDPDGTISSYQWSQISGPNSATLTNENSTTATISGLIQGNYSLSLTVTDNDGATGVDNVIVTVNAAPVNNAPTSNAGADKSITLPTNSIVLSGSGLDSDGTISTYSWTKVSGPTATLSGSNTATLTVNSMLAGSYLFRLTVTDNQGATGSDDVNVTVQPAAVNQSPIANAGSDVGVTLPGTSTILNGSGIDNDGTISTYLWTHISGPSATLSGQTTATLSISNLVTVGSYVFRLTVTDDLGATSFDEAIVTVSSANMAPIANAGLDQILTLPTNSTVINGLGSDSDGTITSYLWTIISGPAAAGLSNANTPDLTVSGLVEGTYILRLTVTDNDLSTGSDDIKVIVTATNMAPVANAGTDKTITLPTNSINIIGSGSDSDGTIVSYLWAKVSGPVATITNSNSQTLSVADAIAGTYVFRLVVTDNLGLTDFDDMQLFVNSPAVNQPPVANAGGNKTITLPVSSTVLSGSGSDPDGTISSYSWTKVSGPVVALTNENTSSLSLSTLVQGTYVFRLTVTDNGGLTATDDATVNVLPQIVNQIPIANAGVDKVLTLPTNSITLFGSGSDPDGSISSYMWSKQSGPASVLTNETTPNLSLSGLVEGAYVFQLAVTDNLSATSTDIVNITVNAMGVNQVPISNAGTNKTISLPTSSININGSGSDPDGSITSYQWSKISGPTATLSNDNQAILSLSDLLEGLYTFSLVVTDNDGATDNDEMTVLVLSGATNQSPSVDAGVDITLVLPTNSVEINGFASDVDGTIVTYAWTKESGGSVTLTNADKIDLSLTNLLEGSYTFRLTATDDDGSIGSDNIAVHVLPVGANIPPIANAGSDRVLTLPTNSLTINGTGNDANGPIASFAWTKVSGPSLTIANETTMNISLSDLVEGVYVFRLTVTDEGGLTGEDEVIVTVFSQTFSQSPVANAGADIFLDLPTNTATLEGSGSDNGGSIVSYSWTSISGPSTPTLSNENTQQLTVSNLVAGTYVFRITVTDNDGLTAFDNTNVIVSPEDLISPPGGTPPVADAGADVTIISPETTALLVGGGTDDGIISSFQWSQISGNPLQLTGIDRDSLMVAGLETGEYIFGFMVTDNDDLTDSDQVKITVTSNSSFPMKLLSPNGDGQNDVWILDPDPNTYSGCPINIYNRRGSVIYQSNSYANDWNATINGDQLPEGVYYYVVNCQSGNSKSGSITIIR